MKKYLLMLIVLLLGACAAATQTPLPETLFPPTTTSFAVYLTEMAASTPQPTLAPTLDPIAIIMTATSQAVQRETRTPTPSVSEMLDGGILVKVAGLPQELLGEGDWGLIAQADGNLWLRTPGKLAVLLASGEWQVAAQAPEGEAILGMDAQGRVYAAAAAAQRISVWQEGAWVVYTEEHGWTPIDGDYAWDWGVPAQRVVSDAQGRAWLATAQDVRVFDGQGWRVFSAEDMGMELPFPGDAYPDLQILYDPGSEALWVGECDWGGPGPVGGAGVRRYLDGEWQGADWAVASGCATALSLAEDGGVWAAVRPEVWRFDPLTEEWSSLGAPQPPEGSRPGYALEIAPDAAGGVWINYTFCGGASCGSPETAAYGQEGTWLIAVGAETLMQAYLIPQPGGAPYLVYENQLFSLATGRMELASALSVIDWTVREDGLLYWVVKEAGGGLSVWMERR